MRSSRNADSYGQADPSAYADLDTSATHRHANAHAYRHTDTGHPHSGSANPNSHATYSHADTCLADSPTIRLAAESSIGRHSRYHSRWVGNHGREFRSGCVARSLCRESI